METDIPDLILGGNEFGFLPQFGRLDGSFGDVLMNDGKGNFTLHGQRKIRIESARSGYGILPCSEEQEKYPGIISDQ